MTEGGLIQFPERRRKLPERSQKLAAIEDLLDPRLDVVMTVLALHCRTPGTKQALAALQARLREQEA